MLSQPHELQAVCLGTWCQSLSKTSFFSMRALEERREVERSPSWTHSRPCNSNFVSESWNLPITS